MAVVVELMTFFMAPALRKPLMSKKAKKQSSGCFATIGKVTVGVLGVIFACALAANMLPNSQTPEEPQATAERTGVFPTSTTVPTVIPTDTAVPIEAPLIQKAPNFVDVSLPTEESAPFVATSSLLPPPTATAEIPPTDTPLPTATDVPPTNTPPPTDTPLPQPFANQAANLRAGPGTNYPVVGGLTFGERVGVVAMSPDSEWLELDTGAWVAAFLISDAGANVAIEYNIPVPPAPPTATPMPVVIEQPTAAPPTATPWAVQVQPQPQQQSCCKICTTGKACGDTCISRSYTCHVGPGCACNAN